MLELEECYFRPRINKYKKKKNKNPSEIQPNKNIKKQEIF